MSMYVKDSIVIEHLSSEKELQKRMVDFINMDMTNKVIFKGNSNLISKREINRIKAKDINTNTRLVNINDSKYCLVYRKFNINTI